MTLQAAPRGSESCRRSPTPHRAAAPNRVRWRLPSAQHAPVEHEVAEAVAVGIEARAHRAGEVGGSVREKELPGRARAAADDAGQGAARAPEDMAGRQGFQGRRAFDRQVDRTVHLLGRHDLLAGAVRADLEEDAVGVRPQLPQKAGLGRRRETARQRREQMRRRQIHRRRRWLVVASSAAGATAVPVVVVPAFEQLTYLVAEIAVATQTPERQCRHANQAHRFPRNDPHPRSSLCPNQRENIALDQKHKTRFATRKGRSAERDAAVGSGAVERVRE